MSMNSLSALLAMPIDVSDPDCSLSMLAAELMKDWDEFKKGYSVIRITDQVAEELPLDYVLRQWRLKGSKALGNDEIVEDNRRAIARRAERAGKRRGK